MAQVAVMKYGSCLSRAFFFPAGAYLQLYARYSIFVHCSPRSTGSGALSLSRNNVPLSQSAHEITSRGDPLEIAIIDHVCDVCSDIDNESLFNTDGWSPLKPGIIFCFVFTDFRARYLSVHTRVRHEIEHMSSTI